MEADCAVSENISGIVSINCEETFNDNETEKEIRLTDEDTVIISDNGQDDAVLHKVQHEDDRPANLQNEEHVSEDVGSNDEDDEAIIVEVEPNQPIDVDEVSTGELVAFDERCEGHPDDTLLQSSAKPTNDTELVIINSRNITNINGGENTEIIDRCPLDIQIKDELAEPITEVICPNDVLENDPMGLLEPNDRSEVDSSTRSHDEPEEYGDDLSSSSSGNTGSSTSNVMDWCKDYPWLLYEEGEDVNGYCLYCDTNLNIKSHSYIKQHGLSLYHKERCDNYLAFREEETRNGLSSELVDIKQEFGTDSRVTALKLKRKTQVEALANFNWRRWLEECCWLERVNSEGTTGRCKYCHIRINVEFSYLRERHQEGARHKESERTYKEESNCQPSNTTNTNNISDEKEEEEIDSASDSSEVWSDVVTDKPNIIVCKPCNSRMVKTSLGKHLRSNLHAHNLMKYSKVSKKKKRTLSNAEVESVRLKQWKGYAKQHPWLMADPSDFNFAYCKYCKKRVIYGNSAAKRATHENSSHHKYNEKNFHKRQRKSQNDDESNPDESAGNKENDDNNGVENSEDENDDEEEDDDNEEENEDNEEEEEINEDENEEDKEADDDDKEEESDQETETEENDNTDSKKRVYRLSEEWLSQFPWSKKHKTDPNSFFCIYCKIPLKAAYNRTKHQNTALHISAEAEYFRKHSKKQQNQFIEPFEWALTVKNNPSMYSCKYCNVTISKRFSKKSHNVTKIHQINENIYKTNRRKSSRQEGGSTELVAPSSLEKEKRYAKVVVKAPSLVSLVKKYQKKFTWLSYKRSEIRSNYGYCKLCENSLFIRSLKHVIKHTRSKGHIRAYRSMIKQKEEPEDEKEKEQEQEQEEEQEEVQEQETESATKNIVEKGPKDEVNESSKPTSDMKPKKQTDETTTTTNDSQKEISSKSTLEELQKRFSWIDKSYKPKLAFCRYCNIHIPIKSLFLRNHSNSSKHRQSVVNYCKTSKKSDKKIIDTETPEKANNNGNENDKDGDDGNNEDDIMALDENAEEVLISEQDENWDVKSETMDEHEELDYLLQRSINNSKNKRAIQRNATLATDEQPSKRIKRSQSFRRLNESNSSLVASLLSTPLTFASCLGPLLQQQIQQATTNAQASSVPASPAQTPVPVEPENTYDLFFKSISETMKKLPVDLAAEGKVKVMQIICDLELLALKRQQAPICESALNNLSGIIYTPTPTPTPASANVANATVVQNAASNDVGAVGGDGGGGYVATEQNGLFGETLVTSYYANTNESLTTGSSRPPYVAAAPNPTPPPAPAPPSQQQTLVTNVETEKAITTPSPVIGVMDKNGLHTLQLKSTVAKQQLPKSTNTSTATAVSNNSSGIRCIPFKNLTQTQLSGDVNSKFTRIHVPLSTSQSTISNATTTSMMNFRNIQITKRVAPNTTAASPSGITTISLAAQQQQQQQQQHQSAIVNNSPQRSYITNIQPQLQRWGCSVNGASPNTPISSSASINNQFAMKQTSTPITRKYN